MTSSFCRYLAIFCPQRKIITSQRALIIILVLWLVPMVLQIPWAVYYEQRTFKDQVSQKTVCFPNYPSTDIERGFFLGVVFLTCYVLPLCFISIFYTLIGLKVWRRNVSGIRGSKTKRNIQKQKIRILRMLIESACEIDRTERTFGMTALDMAILNGDVESTALLVSYGGDEDHLMKMFASSDLYECITQQDKKGLKDLLTFDRDLDVNMPFSR